MPKIISYNVNGIRSVIRKDFHLWLNYSKPEIICLQEIKAKEDQIETSVFTSLGYHCYWYPAQKPGYSGTAILTKIKPDKVHYGIGLQAYDNEGRILRADFGDTSVISVYMPSGSSGPKRQAFKIKFLADFYKYITDLKQQRKKLIISGDYNICHQAIDIHNPQRNKNTSGFLPEERAWVTNFIESGFIDTFRHFNTEPHHYSWWSYRANARKKNLGWRIDYHMITNNLLPQLKSAMILSKAIHSDHCPIMVEINF